MCPVTPSIPLASGLVSTARPSGAGASGCKRGPGKPMLGEHGIGVSAPESSRTSDDARFNGSLRNAETSNQGYPGTPSAYTARVRSGSLVQRKEDDRGLRAIVLPRVPRHLLHHHVARLEMDGISVKEQSDLTR